MAPPSAPPVSPGPYVVERVLSPRFKQTMRLAPVVQPATSPFLPPPPPIPSIAVPALAPTPAFGALRQQDRRERSEAHRRVFSVDAPSTPA